MNWDDKEQSLSVYTIFTPILLSAESQAVCTTSEMSNIAHTPTFVHRGKEAGRFWYVVVTELAQISQPNTNIEIVSFDRNEV